MLRANSTRTHFIFTMTLQKIFKTKTEIRNMYTNTEQRGRDETSTRSRCGMRVCVRNGSTCTLTCVDDGLRRALLAFRVLLLVPHLPGVVHLETSVELVAARLQQVDVCNTRLLVNGK